MTKIQSIKNQYGISLMSFIMWLVIIGVVGGYSVQYGLIYLQKKTIKDSVSDVLAEASKKDMSPKEVQSNLIKRFDVNSLPINKENISVSKNGSKGYKVNVTLVKEIKLGDSMTLLIDSSVEQTSGQ